MINHPMLGTKIADIDLVFFDTETSGAVPGQDQVIQLSAKTFCFSGLREQRFFSKYLKLNNGRHIHPEAQAVHGITEEFLEKHGEPSAHVYNEFNEFLGFRPLLIAHGASFDTAMCAQHSMEVQSPYTCSELWNAAVLDTHFFTRIVHLEPENYKMQTLAEYFNVPGRTTEQHDALEDCIIGANVTEKILSPFSNMPLSFLTFRFPEAFLTASGEQRGINYNQLYLRKKAERAIRESQAVNVSYCKKGQHDIRKMFCFPIEIEGEGDRQYLKVNCNSKKADQSFTLRFERIFDIEIVD